ncbi:kinase-like protein [Leucogyrophana mollusca]|uniref:Kinase-like protein n=1 Tax=Leucogyrophana mollusca TaxID=85980 RepID=A0ACB8BIF8_9AGAM|nr:kinase-like protein [Leucogyrophana mollusca]
MVITSLIRSEKQRHSGDTSAGIRIRKLLRLDTLCIVARILAVLYNHEQRRLLISQRDAQAQPLLDLFQELLDCGDLGPDIRPPLVRAVVELSKASGLYPRSLVLRGVHVKGRGPVNGGSFGDIWEGEFDGRMIAIKLMRLDRDLKAFCKEAVLWRQLSSRHVLPLYGVYHLPERPLQVCLVSPWMANGNIVQYLKDTPQANRHSLVVDVAHGLKYLHFLDPPIVHGDLKGANILIDSSHRARLADFGLGTLVQDSIVRFTPTAGSYLAGTPHYMAPEILSPKEGELTSATRASDIYSFACVCYEVFVGRPRFSGYNTPQLIMAVVIEDRRPSRAPGIDDATWRLMNRCWDKNPASRPSANDLILELSPQTGVPEQEGDQEDPVRRLQSSLTYDLSRALEFAAGEVTERQHPLTEPSPAPRASSDVDSLWTSDMRRTRGISAVSHGLVTAVKPIYVDCTFLCA